MNVYYLEMLNPEEYRPGKAPEKEPLLMECKIKNYKLNRFFYDYVGADWQWVDKKTWTNEQWKAYAEAENLRTFIAYVEGTPAGYFELRKQNSDIELVYFGLEKSFHGQGLGSWLLGKAIDAAWSWNAKRVWLHTCETDHPNALKNYLARGFNHYDTKEE